jgi:hypothetical protein
MKIFIWWSAYRVWQNIRLRDGRIELGNLGGEELRGSDSHILFIGLERDDVYIGVAQA